MFWTDGTECPGSKTGNLFPPARALFPVTTQKAMKRIWPIIAVADVPGSAAWYMNLLAAKQTHPGNAEFDQIVDEDDTVLLCLHYWGPSGPNGDHHWPTLAKPMEGSQNGLLLWFVVDDFDAAWKRAQSIATKTEEEPNTDNGTGMRAFVVQDPDGYHVVINEARQFDWMRKPYCYTVRLMHAKVKAAREFALRAHGNQQYGQHPYSFHLDAVAELLEPYGDDAQIAGYLHDTVEDTMTTLAEIEHDFGRMMAECVALLTDELGENRNARKAKTNAKLASTSNMLALTVKAADRLANLMECQRDPSSAKLQMYRREHQAFRMSAYRAGLCDELWVRIDAIIHDTNVL
jgi:hypothetical protein